MGVTQIIRGDDHLTNAARQKHIYEALGWDTPAFAHIPLIHGPDGAKLSKRHGALGVDAYRAMGYLPAALRNYLARLGWSQGDKEFFTGDELIEAFNLAQVHRSPARFDFVKLENMNGHFMRAMADEELLDALIATLPYLEGGKDVSLALDEKKKAQLLAAMPGLKARAKSLNELLDGAGFLFANRPLAIDEKAEQLLAKGGRERLAEIAPRLSALEEWSAQTTEGAVREAAVALGAKLGDLAQPLRAALTGRATSPGIFDVLAILGRDESLARLEDQIQRVPGRSASLDKQ
jgi:glutamyl-tRNA synthetase